MYHQPKADPNHAYEDTHSAPPDPHRRPSTDKGDGWIGGFLILLLVLAGGAAALELFGITNVVPSLGKGGRPTITLGLWHFTDVPDDFWAQPFIEGLLQKRVISGYATDAFRPEQAITRAEFAAMLDAAIAPEAAPTTLEFEDVPDDFWGTAAITNLSAAGFFVGSPQETFRPNQPLLRTDAFVALSEGLELTVDPTAGTAVQVLSIYEDAAQIPEEARSAIAAATAANLVIRDPSTTQFNPEQPMARAEAAAAVYQVLVHLDKAEAISSPYIAEP